MSITSYAQNFEDVMLWRALGHIEPGRYVDIGAQDPIVDSVSLAFHERGWRGVHVEPTPHYAQLLREQRVGDVVIQAAVGENSSVLRFFEIPGTGISTADAAIAEQHRQRGFDIHEITVPCIALSAVFEAAGEGEIHWLKIDVEGFERHVLSGWGASSVRPWIVVVESTLPLTQIEDYGDWESILIGYGYSFAYFDGLNRYYVATAHAELKAAFRSPPNVFDRFLLSGTSSSPFHSLIEARYNERCVQASAEADLKVADANRNVEQLIAQIAALEHARNEAEHNAESRMQLLSQQADMFRQEAEARRNELAQRDQFFAEQLRANQAGCEELFTAYAQTSENERARLESTILGAIGELAARDEELANHLSALREQSDRESAMLAHIDSLQRSREAFEGEVTESALARSEDIDNLQHKLAATQDELASIRTAWSWVATSPFRRIFGRRQSR
ncbi:FkbM family methyltransferase [Paraburkholderia sp. BL21I4N1]|uniref:FkbM family methyltransferase n=1 Tax=Paraburkholderia sp. BL21I4N1 TaxID=1938801 RepID=UPI000D4A24C2|nr:FkbM family methyltransferase [Paraburkholderia sp. BL21I4N1]PQV49068.1 FkbM family methyltransferase [Paraburkholderia sp. BL21I4N1]